MRQEKKPRITDPWEAPPANPRAGITHLLQNWSEGDDQALSPLIDLVYQRLYSQARYYLNKRPTVPMSGTALVNETFLQLFAGKRKIWQDRHHFFATTAVIMKRFLTREHLALYRDNEWGIGASFLHKDQQNWNEPRVEMLANLEIGLDALEKMDRRKAWIVRLHFLAGMTNPEIAQALRISESTVKRELRFSRAWLAHFLET